MRASVSTFPAHFDVSARQQPAPIPASSINRLTSTRSTSTLKKHQQPQGNPYGEHLVGKRQQIAPGPNVRVRSNRSQLASWPTPARAGLSESELPTSHSQHKHSKDGSSISMSASSQSRHKFQTHLNGPEQEDHVAFRAASIPITSLSHSNKLIDYSHNYSYTAVLLSYTQCMKRTYPRQRANISSKGNLTCVR